MQNVTLRQVDFKGFRLRKSILRKTLHKLG